MNCFFIELSISLGTRSPYRWTFSSIKKSKLNSSSICCTSHKTIQGVYFTNQMPFSKPADSGITRHCSQCCYFMCNKSCLCPSTCRSTSRFTASMATPNNDNIIRVHLNLSHRESIFKFHVKQNL